MEKYYQGTLGHVILEIERRALSNCLEKMFGYHLLQLGGYAEMILPGNSPIAHKIYFNSTVNNSTYNKGEGYIVQGDFCALPFLADSIDVIVMPHLLETAENLKDILEETHRILIPEGHLIVIGFNPFSFLGIAKELKLTKMFDHKANFISAGQISNWLNHLGFDLIDRNTFFFRLPIANNTMLNKTVFMEIVGQMLLPKFGGIYVLIAKKRVITLTPVKQYVFKRKLSILEHST
jgi:SAM-dependent methyltransferase